MKLNTKSFKQERRIIENLFIGAGMEPNFKIKNLVPNFFIEIGTKNLILKYSTHCKTLNNRVHCYDK